jgi:hypothetical protein
MSNHRKSGDVDFATALYTLVNRLVLLSSITSACELSYLIVLQHVLFYHPNPISLSSSVYVFSNNGIIRWKWTNKHPQNTSMSKTSRITKLLAIEKKRDPEYLILSLVFVRLAFASTCLLEKQMIWSILKNSFYHTHYYNHTSTSFFSIRLESTWWGQL